MSNQTQGRVRQQNLCILLLINTNRLWLQLPRSHKYNDTTKLVYNKFHIVDKTDDKDERVTPPVWLAWIAKC